MRVARMMVAGGFALSAVAMLLVLAQPAAAIPAWTRKYGMDCSSCHVAGFKLNRFGQDFLRSGHQMANWEEKQDLGSHLSVAQKSRYNWSQTVVNGSVKPGSKVNSFEQHALSLYMGGPLQKEWSYFAELYWHENSGNTSGSSDLNDYGRSKLADAYLQYIHHEAEAKYTSVRFGQFSPFLLHLHGVGARLSQDRAYVVNSGTVGDNPYKPFMRQYGLEVSQYVQGFTATAAVMNGTGGKLFNRVDNDLKKDVYGTLDYSIDDFGSMLGVYGYVGHYPLPVDNKDLPTGVSGNPIPSSVHYTKYTTYDEFNQIGVLGNFTRKQGALVGAFFSGKNEFSNQRLNEKWYPVDSLTTAVESETKSVGYYAEVQIYALHPRVQPYLRWDFWDPNTDVDDNEVLGPMVGVSWRALDNGRLVAQYAALKTRKGSSTLDETKQAITFELNFMF